METINLQIGEFSKLCGVTVKTLHHYEKLGLITPQRVDEWTGYRYYHVSQLQTMETIRRFKDLGFSLEEIGTLMDSDSQVPSMDLLEAKILQTEVQLRQMLLRRDRLQTIVNTQQKYQIMERFSIQSIPAMTVASYRSIIPNYAAIGDLCVNVIGPEMARLGCQCPEPGYCFTLEHDKAYKDHDIDFEYCEQVLEAKQDSAIIKFRQEPEIPMAVCMKVFGPYDQFYKSFIDLFAYMEKEGYKMIGAPRTCYVDGIWNQSDPEKWLTIIQVPAEKVGEVKRPVMNRLGIYCCPTCGNVTLTYGKGKVECCGQELSPIPIKPIDSADKPTISESDGEYLLEYHHPMTKDFYIAAVVVERYDSVQLFRLFPEQSAQVRVPMIAGAKIYTIFRQASRVWATIG